MALKSQDLEKPQLSFENVPTNRETGPFKPLLQSKPHAITPLEHQPMAVNTDEMPKYPHPYQHEIEQYQYPASVYTHSEPIPPNPFETTSATLVNTEELVEEMLLELKQAREIAIDLEHHDNRSYIGIVSLMQISTRNKDWIVDTLKPWRRKLQCLNEVFANPKIVKVLHGAYMDIVWLQRDLGLYIVGLFDTHYAARALGYTGGSLAFLLKKFVDVDAQKQYQTADWRIRPLQQELLDYARSDTHYLLYIFDCMRNELVERSNFSIANHEGDKLWSVLEKSIEVALQRYEHPVYDFELGQGPASWYKMLSKTSVLLSKEQFAVFRAVHRWRDNVAREQDDSTHYVMANHQIFSIAREMPTTRVDLLSIVHPLTQTVRLRADELVSVIIRAKEEGKEGPDMIDVMKTIEAKFPKYSLPQAEPPRAHAAVPLAPQQIVSPPVQSSTVSSSLPLRSSTSAFWGAALDHTAAVPKRDFSTQQDISLAVPLPPLTAEIFADHTHSTPIRENVNISTTDLESSKMETEETDDIFTLKDLSRKRHRVEEAPDGLATQADQVTLDSVALEWASGRAERGRARREAKLAKKAQFELLEAEANGTHTAANGHEDVAPFDYAAAPSILQPARDVPLHGRDRAKSDRQVNPYAKALDAPKGLPRVQKERAGKSMTYKS